eukprot:SAG31_NODE_12_length_38498_cov_21.161671_37_plen_96_part_00
MFNSKFRIVIGSQTQTTADGAGVHVPTVAATAGSSVFSGELVGPVKQYLVLQITAEWKVASAETGATEQSEINRYEHAETVYPAVPSNDKETNVF